MLLHGFGDSADTWRGVLTSWAGRGRSAVAVDLPGWGEADPLAPGARLPQLDEFVAALADAQGAGVLLVGNSLGGTLAVRAAQRAELGASAVIAMGMPGYGFAAWADRGIRNDARAARALAKLPLPKRLVTAMSRVALRRLLYGDRHAADPKVIDRFCALVPDYRAVGPVLREGAAYAAEVHECIEFDKISCPAVIVHGVHDRIIPAQSARQIHNSVPGSTLVVLDQCGHCPQLDAPTTVTSLMDRYSQHPPAA